MVADDTPGSTDVEVGGGRRCQDKIRKPRVPDLPREARRNGRKMGETSTVRPIQAGRYTRHVFTSLDEARRVVRRVADRKQRGMPPKSAQATDAGGLVVAWPLQESSTNLSRGPRRDACHGVPGLTREQDLWGAWHRNAACRPSVSLSQLPRSIPACRIQFQSVRSAGSGAVANADRDWPLLQTS